MTSVQYRFSSPFSSKRLWFVDTVLWLCPSLPTETLKWHSSLPILMQESFWWWQCSDRYIISVSSHLRTPFPLFSPSLISLMVSVGVKHHVYLLTYCCRNWQRLPPSGTGTRVWTDAVPRASEDRRSVKRIWSHASVHIVINTDGEEKTRKSGTDRGH